MYKKILTGFSVMAFIIFLACLPSVNATSIGSSSASIDWSSVLITPIGQTAYVVFSAYGIVQIDANIKGSTSDVRINQTYPGMNTNIRKTYDYATGNRSVHLDSLVDLITDMSASSQ